MTLRTPIKSSNSTTKAYAPRSHPSACWFTRRAKDGHRCAADLTCRSRMYRFRMRIRRLNFANKISRINKDCRIIIRNKVYDFTEWKDCHPGGPDFFTDFVGGGWRATPHGRTLRISAVPRPPRRVLPQAVFPSYTSTMRENNCRKHRPQINSHTYR